ncbi:MAG: 50S ribosomal protein L11 methyltransferase [Chromatiales bacterium]|jgi:ribosomal protein L11 methyltransferase
MSWLQISIEVSEPQVALLELLFERLGALSVTLADAGDQPLLEPNPGEQKIWQNTRVIGLFEGATPVDELRTAINLALHRDISRNLRIETLEEQVWERLWLEHFKPMRFGRRLWICPAGQPPSVTDAVIVELDPGLAFGTGTHPTTALCLEWLEGRDLAGKSMIDYGCGSGILAIAALRLGAASVVAVDHDPQALDATHDNAQKNHVLERLTTHLPSAAPQRPQDLLVANILAGPLIELAPHLCSLLIPGGRFALSGILAEQASRVEAAYAPFAELGSRQQKEEWVLIQGRKKP